MAPAGDGRGQRGPQGGQLGASRPTSDDDAVPAMRPGTVRGRSPAGRAATSSRRIAWCSWRVCGRRVDPELVGQPARSCSYAARARAGSPLATRARMSSRPADSSEASAATAVGWRPRRPSPGRRWPGRPRPATDQACRTRAPASTRAGSAQSAYGSWASAVPSPTRSSARVTATAASAGSPASRRRRRLPHQARPPRRGPPRRHRAGSRRDRRRSPPVRAPSAAGSRSWRRSRPGGGAGRRPTGSRRAGRPRARGRGGRRAAGAAGAPCGCRCSARRPARRPGRRRTGPRDAASRGPVPAATRRSPRQGTGRRGEIRTMIVRALSRLTCTMSSWPPDGHVTK